MEWKDAIVKVLSDAGMPIHYTEIAEQIVELGNSRRDQQKSISVRRKAYICFTIHKTLFMWDG
jgi:hypothetical protein